MRRSLVLIIMLTLLAGCGRETTTSSSRAVSLATAAPTSAPVVQEPAGQAPAFSAQDFPKLREPIAPIAVDDARSLGDPKAPVTIVEYSDFECPFCQRHFIQVFPDLKAKYIDTGKVRYVFRNYIAVPSHTSAPAAAIASMCAAEQGKFWELHDELYQKADEWTADASKAMEVINGYSKNLGLDMTKFESCSNDPSLAGKIQTEGSEAQTLGAQGTPAFFVGQYLVGGAYPIEAFDVAIELAMQDAK